MDPSRLTTEQLKAIRLRSRMRNRDYLSRKDKEAMMWVNETGSIADVGELARVLGCTNIVANTILQRLQALGLLQQEETEEKEPWQE